MTTSFQRFIADGLAVNAWTPDVPLIESQDIWPVFMYNNNKRGRFSSYFTHTDSDAHYFGIGWTNSKVYSILNVEKGEKSFQLATISGTDQIMGEVWGVTPEDLMELDGEERNLLYTKRILVPIYMSKGKTISAWMYIAHPKFLLDGGIRISKYAKYSYYGDTKLLEIE